MVNVHVTVTGLAELQEVLEKAPLKASRQIMRKGLLAAAYLWQQEMMQTVRRGPHHGRGKGAPIDFGVLARDIVLRARVTSDLVGTASVGPDKRAYWAKFLEFGRKAGVSRRGRHFPAMRPFPFIRASFEARKRDVLDEFIIETKAALEAAGLHLR